MVSRLYYDDANNLQHFRLIYEDDSDYLMSVKFITLQPTLSSSQESRKYTSYAHALASMEKINSIIIRKDSAVFAYSATKPAKMVKIFEKVKGAHIEGNLPKNTRKNSTKVSLTLTLKTKYNRIFTYEQTTIAKNGKYSFIVPYPTTKILSKNYSYDITPISQYIIRTSGKKINVKVPEKAVMLGETIQI